MGTFCVCMCRCFPGARWIRLVCLDSQWYFPVQVMTFDNSTPFEGKIRRVIRSVSRIIGFPLTKKKFKKFTLAAGAKLPESITQHAEVFDVEKVSVG